MNEKMNALVLKVKENKNKLLVPAVAVGSMASALPVFAAEGDGNITADMTTAMTSAFNAVKTDVISVITTALPPALAIMGIGIALAIGVKFFRRFSGR